MEVCHGIWSFNYRSRIYIYIWLDFLIKDIWYGGSFMGVCFKNQGFLEIKFSTNPEPVFLGSVGDISWTTGFSSSTFYKNCAVVSNISYFHPYLGMTSILTKIFQWGWNHQLENDDSISVLWTRLLRCEIEVGFILRELFPIPQEKTDVRRVRNSDSDLLRGMICFIPNHRILEEFLANHSRPPQDGDGFPPDG